MWNANSANGKRNCESGNWALSDCSVIGHTSGKGIFSSTNSVAMENSAQYRELLITKDQCTVPGASDRIAAAILRRFLFPLRLCFRTDDIRCFSFRGGLFL